MNNKRLDIYLVEKGFYTTRAKAAAAIKNNLVTVNDTPAQKPSQQVSDSDKIETRPLPYISGRGSLKLAHALNHFNINPAGHKCLDVGASTGGFTEVLLSRGAKTVIAVDVGSNQLIPEIRNNPRVTTLEQTDIRTLPPKPGIDLIVIDVSFISLTNIADAIAAWHAPAIIALIKPQFEVPRNIAARTHGVIKSDTHHREAIDKVISCFQDLGYKNSDITQSPILGGSGNIEYLAYFTKESENK